MEVTKHWKVSKK